MTFLAPYAAGRTDLKIKNSKGFIFKPGTKVYPYFHISKHLKGENAKISSFLSKIKVLESKKKVFGIIQNYIFTQF